MNSLIPTMTPEELNNLSDSFWIKLGVEHCNMKKSISHIIDLLSINFTKSNPMLKLFWQFYTLYSDLSCVLDDVVCRHYPYRIPNKEDVMFIDIPPSLHLDFNQIDGPSDYEKRSITSLFYKSDTVKRYPATKYKKEVRKRHSGYISPQDMEHITDFITNQDNYFKYLRIIYQKITDNSREHKNIWQKKILKSVQNIDSKRRSFDGFIVSHIRVEANYEIDRSCDIHSY